MDEKVAQEWSTFSDLYRIRRGAKEYGELVGIVLAFLAALIEYLPAVPWSKIVCLPESKIPDGYFLVLLSPFVAVWFVFWFAVFLVMEAFVSVLIVAALPYTLVFEVPAEFIRKKTVGGSSDDEAVS